MSADCSHLRRRRGKATLHQDITNEGQAENDIVLNTLKAEVILETLNTGMGEGVSVDVVHDVHKELYLVSFVG